jgi:hypothetical protein
LLQVAVLVSHARDKNCPDECPFSQNPVARIGA